MYSIVTARCVSSELVVRTSNGSFAIGANQSLRRNATCYVLGADRSYLERQVPGGTSPF
jgi:hypothetical protein